MTPVWEHGPDIFLYLHDDYVHPRHILKHDHISLQAVTATHVVFAVTDPGVNVYDMAKHPFVMMAQYTECRKLVLVPHWAVVRLSESMGDPVGREVIGYGMSARSGSTLICQMFNKLPDTVAICEPWALYHAHKLFMTGFIRKDTYPLFLQALLRLQFKKMHEVFFCAVLLR